MSLQLISRSPDLRRLIDDKYEVELRSGTHLLIHGVPYVNSKKEVARGTLVSALLLNGNATIAPTDHVALFVGDYPCRADGTQLTSIVNDTNPQTPLPGLVTNYSFSSKPLDGLGYKDFHHKMTSYINILVSEALQIDPNVSARTGGLVRIDDPNSVFHYFDTASSNAGIAALNDKLALGKVAIIGLGGSGSYILDLVAKTPIREIHLFDGDDFLQHNAFRAPGAASMEDLEKRLLKVDYWAQRYAPMRKGIIPHGEMITESNVDQLKDMQFVFISVDSGTARRLLAEALERLGVPFIDVGMGVEMDDESLGPVLRVTTSTATQREHTRQYGRLPFTADTEEDEYAKNIQIADLNALNATLAVIKWKKLFGFYRDLEMEHFSTFTVDGNALLNLDTAPA